AAARERAAAEKQVATLKAELARRGESVAGGQELSQLRTAVERQRALGEIDTREIALLRAALARQRGVIEVLSTPELRIGALSQVKPGTVARGHMVWNEHGKAWLISTFGLPAPPAGKAYQAWFLTEKGGPVSAGLFTADQAGTGLVVAASPAQRFGKVSAVAVTLEPAEGLTKPSGEIYLRGSL
ncbi:MAG: anti-sigma factor, partial [Candidatus Binatia bacterium]